VSAQRRSELREEEWREEGIRAVIPIPAQHFVEFIKSSRTWLEIERNVAQRLGISARDLQVIADLAVAAISLWATDAGVVASIASPDSFEKDMKRKIVGLAETIKHLVQREISVCTELVEVLASEGGATELTRQAAASQEHVRKAIEECRTAMLRARYAPLAYLLVIDWYLGLAQSNLPVSMMSNAIKGRLGIVTD